MKYYKLKYPDGEVEFVRGTSMSDIIKRYDLENVDVRIFELSGEQQAIAIANFQEQDGIW